MKFKSTIQSLLRQNYHVTYPYHRSRLWLEGQFRKDKIVIYQMAKVGSTTIWKSLESLNLATPIYHIHTLDPERVNIARERDRTNFPKLKFIYPETIHSEYLRGQLDYGIKTPWSVITIVRDPVAKILSGFFQRLEAELLLGLDYRKNIAEKGEAVVLEEVIQRFYQEHFNNPNRRHPFEWFNHEIKKNLDFDVFSAPALADKSYCIYNAQIASILVLKLEYLNASYKVAFQDFLGIDSFELVQANIGKEKRYKNLYRTFLREVDLPISYLDSIYQTDLVRHFYSESEIQQFYQRWSAS